jgi:hypothetical protein
MKRPYNIVLLAVLFLAGVIGGYLVFMKVFPQDMPPEDADESLIMQGDLFSLRMYFPVNDRLVMEERRLPRRSAQIAIAEAAVEEFLKGPSGGVISDIPSDARLLGLYKDTDQILYVDLSDEFRRNFQGDAYTEFFLLKGLYETLISNVPDIQDIKILIEGKEIETLGGHLYLLYPLKASISYELE